VNKPLSTSLRLGQRATLISVLIASGALLIAACGSSPNNAAVAHLRSTTTTDPGGSQGGSAPVASNSSDPSGGSGLASGSGPQRGFAIATGGTGADALAFSECMRSHGVPNFPDPNAQGVIQGSGINPSSSSFQAANKDCRHLLPNGGVPTPAEQAKALAQALKMSQCMRSHGITDFPDPQTGAGGGIRISLHSTPGSDLNPNSPKPGCTTRTPLGIFELTTGPKG
jgi:hypothetical protein